LDTISAKQLAPHLKGLARVTLVFNPTDFCLEAQETEQRGGIIKNSPPNMKVRRDKQGFCPELWQQQYHVKLRPDAEP